MNVQKEVVEKMTLLKGTIQLKSKYVLKCVNLFIIMPEMIDFLYIIIFRLPTANRHAKLALFSTHLTSNHSSLFSLTLLIWLSSLIYVLFLSTPLQPHLYFNQIYVQCLEQRQRVQRAESRVAWVMTRVRQVKLVS